MPDTEEWFGWHFLPSDGRLYGNGHLPDGGRIKVEVGKTLKVKPPLRICKHGFHACRRALDALQYAPDMPRLLACYVRLSGEILEPDGDDKSCATERTVLWMIDATEVLHEFSCWCAERALQRANINDKRLWGAIAAKRAWMAGEITDEEVAIARAAGWAAWPDWATWPAWPAWAVWAASWDAGCGAAWTAWASVRAVRAAAKAARAAWDVVRDVARGEEAKQNAKLEAMLKEAAGVVGRGD